jgi:hypothetical protein
VLSDVRFPRAKDDSQLGLGAAAASSCVIHQTTDPFNSKGSPMSFFSTNTSESSVDGCTTIVHRAAGGIAGVREVFDNSSRLAVTAAPIVMAKDIFPAGTPVAGCYILADNARIYIGESSNLRDRLVRHAADPAKAFAYEVFVITGGGNASFDKSAAVYLQHRLTRAAEAAALVEVQKGTGAQVLDLPPWRRATLDRIVEDVARLLFDAGCRAFHSNCASTRKTNETVAAAEIDCDGCAEADESGAMEIGVVATPTGAIEYQLAYGDLWARGYTAQDGFVVTAGSEVRTEINPSVNPILHTRRDELEDAGVLADIPGLSGRKRLLLSVWFPSWAIAAKVICGAHVASNKWTAVRNPRPFILAA